MTTLERYKVQAYIVTAVFVVCLLVFIWQLPAFFYGGEKTNWMTAVVAVVFSVTMFMWTRYITEDFFNDTNNDKKKTMSGGHFEYVQYQIERIAEETKEVIVKNNVEVPPRDHERWDYDENGNLHPWAKYYYSFSPETIEKFKEGYRKLKEAYIYAQRIDWLLSGDDGEDTFHERLKEDLKELEANIKNEKWLYEPNKEED